MLSLCFSDCTNRSFPCLLPMYCSTFPHYVLFRMFLKQYWGRGGDSESDEFEAKTEDILKQDRGAVEIQERCSIILVFDKILVFEAEVQERCLIKSRCLKQRSYEQCWLARPQPCLIKSRCLRRRCKNGTARDRNPKNIWGLILIEVDNSSSGYFVAYVSTYCIKQWSGQAVQAGTSHCWSEWIVRYANFSLALSFCHIWFKEELVWRTAYVHMLG